MTEDERELEELDWKGLLYGAVERLNGQKPFKLGKDLGPSCQLAAAVAKVFAVSVAEATRLCELFEFDPKRRVRKPQ